MKESSPVASVGPPHLETSQLVEDWEDSDYLPRRLGARAHIGNVITVVDAGSLVDQLCSSEPISAHGWGRTAHDARTVADITAGQVESATHLLLVGPAHSDKTVADTLMALNPTAERLVLDHASDDRLRAFLSGTRAFVGHPHPVGSARVIPPWLVLLRAEDEGGGTPDRFVYRRSQQQSSRRVGSILALLSARLPSIACCSRPGSREVALAKAGSATPSKRTGYPAPTAAFLSSTAA